MTASGPSLPEGFRLCRYEVLGSTNDEARGLAQQGAAAGTVVWAAAQNAGRGRRGRVWASPPGNLYVSLILRPPGPAARVPQLGFVAALALGDAIDDVSRSALPVRFKWPNDVLIEDRKLAGILLESETTTENRVDFVVVGVGVNVASAPHGLEYPATCLMAEGVVATPPELLEPFARRVAAWIEVWEKQGFPPVRAAWLRRASAVGAPIRVRLDRLTLDGRFLDLDADGALLLDGPDGPRRITAGEIFPALA